MDESVKKGDGSVRRSGAASFAASAAKGAALLAFFLILWLLLANIVFNDVAPLSVLVLLSVGGVLGYTATYAARRFLKSRQSGNSGGHEVNSNRSRAAQHTGSHSIEDSEIKQEFDATRRFHLLASASRDAVYDWDLVTGKVWRNDNYRVLFSKSSPVETDITWWKDRIHHLDTDRVFDSLGEALNSKLTQWTCAYRFRRSDGSYASVEDSGSIIRNDNGQAIRIIGTIADISDHIHSVMRYRTQVECEKLISQISSRFLGLTSTELDAAITDALRRVAKFIGADSAAVYRDTPGTDVVHRIFEWNARQKRVRTRLDTFRKSQFPWLNRLISEVGKPIMIASPDEVPDTATVEKEAFARLGVQSKCLLPISIHDTLVGSLRFIWLQKQCRLSTEQLEPLMVFGDMIFTVLQRSEAEKALRKSERRLELALQGAELAIWDWDVRGVTDVFTNRWMEEPGFSPMNFDENQMLQWRSLMHPDDLTRFTEALTAHLHGQSSFFEVEYRFKSRTGWKWIFDRGQVIERDARGQPLRAVGIHFDITDRRST